MRLQVSGAQPAPHAAMHASNSCLQVCNTKNYQQDNGTGAALRPQRAHLLKPQRRLQEHPSCAAHAVLQVLPPANAAHGEHAPNHLRMQVEQAAILPLSCASPRRRQSTRTIVGTCMGACSSRVSTTHKLSPKAAPSRTPAGIGRTHSIRHARS